MICPIQLASGRAGIQTQFWVRNPVIFPLCDGASHMGMFYKYLSQSFLKCSPQEGKQHLHLVRPGQSREISLNEAQVCTILLCSFLCSWQSTKPSDFLRRVSPSLCFQTHWSLVFILSVWNAHLLGHSLTNPFIYSFIHSVNINNYIPDTVSCTQNTLVVSQKRQVSSLCKLPSGVMGILLVRA